MFVIIKDMHDKCILEVELPFFRILCVRVCVLGGRNLNLRSSIHLRREVLCNFKQIQEKNFLFQLARLSQDDMHAVKNMKYLGGSDIKKPSGGVFSLKFDSHKVKAQNHF